MQLGVMRPSLQDSYLFRAPLWNEPVAMDGSNSLCSAFPIPHPASHSRIRIRVRICVYYLYPHPHPSSGCFKIDIPLTFWRPLLFLQNPQPLAELKLFMCSFTTLLLEFVAIYTYIPTALIETNFRSVAPILSPSLWLASLSDVRTF